MRRLLPIILVALAACQVDVEGAPCRGLGLASEDCPAGQGCGLDGKCSARAAAPSCALCPNGADRCKDAEIQKCSAEADPVCGEWQTTNTCEVGLVCGEKSGAPSCECPQNEGPEFAADPAGSRALDTAPYPTGASAPPACRFGRLGDALRAAAAYVAAHPGTRADAVAHGEMPPVTFGVAETDETFPLEIAPGVVLRTAASTPDPTSWIIRADTTSASDVITLHDGAGVEGLTVASVSASGNVVRLSCVSQTKATLSRLIVQGGGVAARGVKVVGPCDLQATELSITGATGTGLYVDVDLASAEPVTGASVSGGAVTGNGGNGIEVRSGLVRLVGTNESRFLVSDNAGHGLQVRPRMVTPAPAIAVDLDRADFARNGEVGILLRDLPAGSSAVIRSTDVHENRALTTASAFFGARRAGGVILWGAAAPMTFAGNRLWANASDQVGVLSSDTWHISGEDCGGGANVFACPSASGYLVYSAAATQTAGHAYWPATPWPPGPLLYNTEYQTGDEIICPLDLTRLPNCPSP